MKLAFVKIGYVKCYLILHLSQMLEVQNKLVINKKYRFDELVVFSNLFSPC